MIGYRITYNRELNDVLSNKRIVPNHGETHEDCHNTFGRCGHAFWFFTTLSDAERLFDVLTYYDESGERDKSNLYVICEYDIPDDIITTGEGYYWRRPVHEFITRELRGSWLKRVYHVKEYETDTCVLVYEVIR